MYGQLKLNEKIDLLLICIETLHAYQYTSSKSDKYYDNLWKDLFDIKHHHYIRNVSINNFEEHTKTIQIILSIYRIIKKLYLEDMIIHILKNSCHQSSSLLVKQYIKRYKYIYQKTQSYYNIKSHYIYNQSSIEYTAMANLYIINQIYNIKGLYSLIKYLYEC